MHNNRLITDTDYRWMDYYRVDQERAGCPLPWEATTEVQHPDKRQREHGSRQQLRGHHHGQRGHAEAGAALHRHCGASPPRPPPCRRDRYHHHSRLLLPLRVAATAARWHIWNGTAVDKRVDDVPVTDPRRAGSGGRQVQGQDG